MVVNNKKKQVILCGYGLTASKSEFLFEKYDIVAYAYSEISKINKDFLKKNIPIIEITDISKYDYDCIVICSSLNSSFSLCSLLVENHVIKENINFLLNNKIISYKVWTINRVLLSVKCSIKHNHTKITSTIIHIFLGNSYLRKFLKKDFVCKQSVFSCTDKIFSIPINKYSLNLRNQMMYKSFLEKNSLIQKGDKILVIAPHPDDESIGTGGIISKYTDQCDVLCVNSSGIKYDWNSETAEEIAEIRSNEFYSLMDKIGIKNRYVSKIYGEPPFFNEILDSFEIVKTKFSLKDYKVIFTPYIYDGHREHQFISDFFLKKLLSKSKLRNDLLIAEYEVWSTIKDVNYFEDISDFIDSKERMIRHYHSRKDNRYFECISGLNNYRGLLANCKYAEAFKVSSAKEFLSQTSNYKYFY